jgi:hypothetical protein
MSELVHLQRRFVRRIECGTTGPVRVTEKLSETTCPDCRTADEQRRHLNNCDDDGCKVCASHGIIAEITAVDVVRLLTADPATEFTIGQLDAIHDAQWYGFVTIADSALRPTLVAGVTYCVTCLLGCNHECGPESCEHAGCWGTEATNDCAGRTFEQLALSRMTGHDWQVAESALAVTP